MKPFRRVPPDQTLSASEIDQDATFSSFDDLKNWGLASSLLPLFSPLWKRRFGKGLDQRCKPPTWGDPLERRHRPSRFRVGHTNDDRSRSFSSEWAFVPFTLNEGLMKARKGISPGQGARKRKARIPKGLTFGRLFSNF